GEIAIGEGEIAKLFAGHAFAPRGTADVVDARSAARGRVHISADRGAVFAFFDTLRDAHGAGWAEDDDHLAAERFGAGRLADSEVLVGDRGARLHFLDEVRAAAGDEFIDELLRGVIGRDRRPLRALRFGHEVRLRRLRPLLKLRTDGQQQRDEDHVAPPQQVYREVATQGAESRQKYECRSGFSPTDGLKPVPHDAAIAILVHHRVPEHTEKTKTKSLCSLWLCGEPKPPDPEGASPRPNPAAAAPLCTLRPPVR